MEADVIPASGYTLNMTESYCGQSQDGEIVKDDTVSFVYENGSMAFSNVTKKGTSCYLYFDEPCPEGAAACEAIVANNPTLSDERSNGITGPLTEDTTGTLFTAPDDYGTSLIFAGNIDNNWVRFGGYYWRIIRINGDGTIRMIYAGEDTGSVTDANRTGTTTQISLDGSTVNYSFNAEWNKSEFVGLMYTQGSQHGNTENSDILDMMNTWYTTNISSLDQVHVDTSTWFCSDRNMASGYSWSSQPNDQIIYAAYVRLRTNKAPTLRCSSSTDQLATTYGVGLVTADEVAIAGGVYGIDNTNYYLYNGQNYWTMTPNNFDGSSDVLIISSSGSISMGNDVTFVYGIRPVINLRADTIVTGDGTASSPFEIQN